MNSKYSAKSSALVFLLALLLPSVVTSIWVLIVKDIKTNVYYYYIALALSQLTMFAIFLVFNKLKNVNGFKECKLKFNLNFKQILIIITCGLVALFSFSPLVNLVEGILLKCGYNAGNTFDLKFNNFGIFSLAILILGLLPAICEELIFRGLIMQGYKEFSKKTIVFVTAFLFMIMHLNIEQTIYQFVLGMVLCCVVLITGSLLSSIILHFVNNVTILIINYLYEINNVDTSIKPYNFSVWNVIYPILVAIIGCVAIYFLLKLLKRVSIKKTEFSNVTDETTEKCLVEQDINSKNEDLKNNSAKDNKLQISNSYWVVLPVVLGIIMWIINLVSSL